MVIDSHVHIGYDFNPLLVDYIMGGQRRELADQLILDMDANGIDMAITFGLLDLNTTYQAEIQQRYPDRIVSCAWIDPHRPNSVEEFRHGVEKLGIKGLKLHGWWHQTSMADHAVLDAYMEICEEYHLPVIMHGFGDNCFTTPYQIEEMAASHPGINFVMAHGGNNWLGEEAIIAVGRTENLWMDTASMQSYWVQEAVKRVGAHKVCMGSDYPWFYLDTTRSHLERILPDPEDREWVMGRSIATVFGIPWK